MSTATARRSTLRFLPALVLLVAALVLPAHDSDAKAPKAQGGAVKALFFGDSLMTGTGTRPTRPVMAKVAGRILGWTVTVDGWGGTGFTTGGKQGIPYLQRLSAPGLLSTPYDVVLLEGGTNDRAADLDDLRDRVVETVDYVQERLPNTRIVLMGAFNPRTHRYDERRNDVDRVLREIAIDRDVPFFSPLSGNWGRGQGPRFLTADGLHPTAYGYGVMGVRLAAELRGLDLSSR